MIVDLRRSGVKKYKKGKRIVTYLETKMDSLTQPKWLLPRAQGNQPQEASIGGLIGPPVVEIWIFMYIAATMTILGCFWW